MGGGGGAVIYMHSLVHFHLPSFPSLNRPKFRNPKTFLLTKELADRASFSSIRAKGNGERPQKTPSERATKAEELEENPQSVDCRSPLPLNKEKILALFKRIQVSISKGETMNSKRRNSKIADDKPSAEAIFEVLHQSRTQGKGQTSAKRVGKSLVTRKDDSEVHLPAVSLKSTRPESGFTRKSPILTLLSRRDKAEQENEALPAKPTPPIPEAEIVERPEELPATDDSNANGFSQFKEMNLAQLKDVAKCNGIKGYSKLKKSELIELLTQSLNNTCP